MKRELNIFDQFKKEDALWQVYIDQHGDTPENQELRGVGEYAVGTEEFYDMVAEANGRKLRLVPVEEGVYGNAGVEYEA